jgi:hypothetical protein
MKYGVDMKEPIDLKNWVKNLTEQEKRYKNATDLKDENGALMSMVLLAIALHEELDEKLMKRLRADKDLQHKLETGNEPPPIPVKTAKIFQFKRKEQ